MDALALLCNLYGDGPATLRRLRESGCSELADLARLPVDQLARLLGGTHAAARRFRHEAELLAARGLEAKDVAESDLAANAVARAALGEAARTDEPRSPLERALAAWRAADDAAAVAGDDTGADADSGDGAAREPAESFARNADSPSAARSDAATALRAGTPLRPELVEGLDAVACARLRQAGIEHAEELLTAELLELSSACDIALTRLMRIQGHVRRLVAPDSTGLLVPHPRRQERFSPDPLAAERRERTSEDADTSSGPFA